MSALIHLIGQRRLPFSSPSCEKEPITWNPVPNEMTIPQRPPETDHWLRLMSSFVKTAFGMLVLMSAAMVQYCPMQSGSIT